MADEQRERRSLSKNVLQMKFMQRRQEAHIRRHLEDERKRAISESHWVLHAADEEENGSNVEVEPSYVVCEQLLPCGRMSFKNFNPPIEKLYKEMLAEEELRCAEEKEKEEAVSDEEMARRYETLVGTIAKKFSGKRKRASTAEEYENSPVLMASKKRKGFLKPSD